MSGGKFFKRLEGRDRRRKRVRKKVSGTPERPRLSVFRSNRHMYSQLIDDVNGVTLVSASTMDKELRGLKGHTKTEQARRVGELIARRALEKGIERVVFDRDGYKYHGRVRALAEAARQGGLIF